VTRPRKVTRKVTRKVAVAFGLAAVLTVDSAVAAFANPRPPTNGGDGAGQSGQCTGNPDDRPTSARGPSRPWTWPTDDPAVPRRVGPSGGRLKATKG